MSWEIIGDVFIKDERVCSASFNRMKNLSDCRNIDNLQYVNHLNISDEDLEKYKGPTEEGYGDGYLFDISCFENALELAKKDYEKEKEIYAKLNKIRCSIDFYNMSEEGKLDYFDDVEAEAETLQELEWKVDTISYVLHLIEFLSNTYNPDVDELNYISENDIKIYLYPTW